MRARIAKEVHSLRASRFSGFVAPLLFAMSCRPDSSGRAKDSSRPPDLVVVSIDTLRRDAVDRAIEAGVPGFADLARSAARFSGAVSSAPWTLPAHASLFTGLYPDRHGASHPALALAPDVTTVAQQLTHLGYLTAAFTEKGFLDVSYGLGRGFQIYDEIAAPESASLARTLPRGGAPRSLESNEPFDRGLAFLRSAPEGRPFFLFLHTFIVHDYYASHEWTRGPESRPLATEVARACLRGERTCDAATWREFARLYDAEVRNVGEHLRRLLEAVDASARRCVVVVTSDHGEGFDPDRGRIHHEGRVDADLIEIPLFIRQRGAEAISVADTVSIVDIAPTVLDVAGQPTPDGIDGRSLLPLVAGEPSKRTAYAMEFSSYWKDGRRHRIASPRTAPLLFAVIDERSWFEISPASFAAFRRSAPEQRDDSRETARDRDRVLDTLRRRSAHGTLGPARAASVRVDENLRSLGYLK